MNPDYTPPSGSMNPGAAVGIDTSKIITGKIPKKKLSSNVPLPTKIVGWTLLAPVLGTTAVTLWAGFWKVSRILVEWALG